jgi:hypothetical protein
MMANLPIPQSPIPIMSLLFRHDYSGYRNERILLWKFICLFLQLL